MFRDYLAPDPVGDVPGSISFGVYGAPETIAPTATLVPPIDTALPALQGGPPTCLSVTRDAGVTTALAFVASGTVAGSVELVPDLFGSGMDAYVIADRLFAPVDAVMANPGLAALIKTAADAGSHLSITFQIDLDTGIPTGFDATTTLSGPVVMFRLGGVGAGAATLPDAVIDPEARSALQEAADIDVPATVTVDGAGTIDQSSEGGVAIEITLSVSFVPPAPSQTSTPTATVAPLPDTAMNQRHGAMGHYSSPAMIGAFGIVVGSALALTLKSYRSGVTAAWRWGEIDSR